jgi:hypothetical protein
MCTRAASRCEELVMRSALGYQPRLAAKDAPILPPHMSELSCAEYGDVQGCNCLENGHDGVSCRTSAKPWQLRAPITAVS